MMLDRLVQDRAPTSWKLTKIKGHGSARDVQEGKVVNEDKEGNDWADALAVADCARDKELWWKRVVWGADVPHKGCPTDNAM